jgi:hypothetical protein
MPKESKKERRERWQAALDAIEFPQNHLSTVKEAFHKYSGDFTVLESAVGAFFLGMMIGWRPLVIIHSPKTIKRYETILNVNFKELMPESNNLSDRSNGYELALSLDNFWSAVTGNTSIEGRKTAIGLDSQEV